MSDSQRQEVELVIEHGVVLPMTGEQDLSGTARSRCDGGRIVAVGTTAELRRGLRPEPRRRSTRATSS